MSNWIGLNCTDQLPIASIMHAELIIISPSHIYNYLLLILYILLQECGLILWHAIVYNNYIVIYTYPLEISGE